MCRVLAPRVADRLVVETLMVEALDELRCRALAPDEAAAVMALAGESCGDVQASALSVMVQSASGLACAAAAAGCR
jgi:hypothetical protein